MFQRKWRLVRAEGGREEYENTMSAYVCREGGREGGREDVPRQEKNGQWRRLHDGGRR